MGVTIYFVSNFGVAKKAAKVKIRNSKLLAFIFYEGKKIVKIYGQQVGR